MRNLIKSEYIHRLGTLFDPNYDENAYFNNSSYQKAISAIQSEFAHRLNENAPNVESASQEKSKPMFTGLLAYLNSFRKNTTSRPTPINYRSAAIVRVTDYLVAAGLTKETNPVKFWKQYHDSALRSIAFKYLTVQATSVASERTFSKSGYIVSERRNRLKPETVEKLVFLNKNVSF